MNLKSKNLLLPPGVLAIALLTLFSPLLALAQWPYGPTATPNDQRNALNALRGQINWFQNVTRTAPNFGEQGYGQVQGGFASLRGAYNGFKATLNERQQAQGANGLAELDGGLDIIQEAFANFQNDVAGGRPPDMALRDLCQVMREAVQVWGQEMNKYVSRLHIGMG